MPCTGEMQATGVRARISCILVASTDLQKTAQAQFQAQAGGPDEQPEDLFQKLSVDAFGTEQREQLLFQLQGFERGEFNRFQAEVD